LVVSTVTDFVLFGVHADTKPLAGIATNTLFFEIDTGDIYKFTGGVWSLFSGRAKQETLTNKTLTLPIISSISNSGTVTIPTGTRTLVGRDTTDTLTNKTLTFPAISTISNGGVITLPTGTRTLVARDTADTLLSKTISVNSNTVTATSQALGDILINNGTQFIRLARGTNGQVLTATATTINWAAPASSTGASTTVANTWTAAQTFNDTFLVLRNPANTFSVTMGAGAQTAARTFTFPVTASDTIQLLAATQTPTNKTISLTNNTVNDTSIATGDLAKSNGTKFVRFAKGTANQVLTTNSGATDLAWSSFNSETTGTALASGTGSATLFNIAHSLGSTPYSCFVQCYSHSTAFTYAFDATNIAVTFVTAPPSGTNNVKFTWRALV
jgi:hypothetical protein